MFILPNVDALFKRWCWVLEYMSQTESVAIEPPLLAHFGTITAQWFVVHWRKMKILPFEHHDDVLPLCYTSIGTERNKTRFYLREWDRDVNRIPLCNAYYQDRKKTNLCKIPCQYIIAIHLIVRSHLRSVNEIKFTQKFSFQCYWMSQANPTIL